MTHHVWHLNMFLKNAARIYGFSDIGTWQKTVKVTGADGTVSTTRNTVAVGGYGFRNEG